VRQLSLPAGVLLAALAQAGVGAINVRLGLEDIQRATDLARFPHTDAERAQFHKRYTVAVNSRLVEYFVVENIEVITPFRRMELIAEEHARVNDLFARGGLRDAEDALQPWRDRLAIAARLGFDQTKVIPDVPAIDVTIEGPTPVLSTTVNSSGIYTFTGDRRWLVGGLVEAVFDVHAVSQATLPVVVRWNGKEIARVAVDFGALE
jgi:hypothetical protein